MKTATAIVLSIIAIIIISALPGAFAMGFEKSEFKLQHAPTLCALETGDQKFPDIGKRLLAYTDYGIIDWKQKLNEGLGKHPAWDIKLQRVSLQTQKGFDYSGCDIIISFKPKPDNTDPRFVPAGVTRYDYDNKRASIEIYYLQVETNAEQTSWSDGYYIYTKTTWTPYYTGFMAADPQLSMTIRHEIGHALGLGHYLVDQQSKELMISGQRDMPSIMVDTNIVTGNTHYSITQLDIQQLKLKYGLGGFDTQGPTEKELNKFLTVKNGLRDWATGVRSDNALNEQVFRLWAAGAIKFPPDWEKAEHNLPPEYFKKVAIWWANGLITDDDFFAGLQYLISSKIWKI